MGAETPVMPTGLEESKKSMVKVGCILDNAFQSAQTAFMVNVFNGGQLGAGDPSGSFHHCWSALQSDAKQLPYNTEMQLVNMLSMVQWKSSPVPWDIG